MKELIRNPYDGVRESPDLKFILAVKRHSL